MYFKDRTKINSRVMPTMASNTYESGEIYTAHAKLR